MANFVLAYHGGKMADSPEAQQAEMAKWGAWFGSLGEAVVDGGNPISQSRTVGSDGSVADGGGANPLSGYSVVSAGSLDDAVTIVKDCPILANGGSVEVCETITM